MDNMTKQIPPGYKKTEIGIIPEDWEVKRLGEIFSILKTASFSKSDLSSKGDILYIHYGDIHTKWVHFLDLKKEDLPHIEHSKSRNYPLVKEGDLIMVDASEDYEGIGKSVEIKNVGNKKVISGLHTLLLRDSQGKFVNGFKGFVTHNRIVKKQIETLATGLKVYGISKQNLKDVLIPIPPLPEQRAIARVLSDIDHLIESLDRLIEKKKLIKKGAMQLLLTGKKRLPGFKGEWVRKRLGEVAIIKKGDLITEKEARRGNVPVIGGGIGPTYYHNKANRKANTITISASGANAGYVSFHKHPIFASDCSTIEKSGNYDVRFLYFLLKSMQNTITMLQTGGAQPHVYPEQLKQLEIYYPLDMEEQRAIAQILSDMDAEIETLERKKEKYEMIKKGTMELLLTGKIRLKDYIDEVLG